MSPSKIVNITKSERVSADPLKIGLITQERAKLMSNQQGGAGIETKTNANISRQS
jgi:hypothetical protein